MRFKKLIKISNKKKSKIILLMNIENSRSLRNGLKPANIFKEMLIFAFSYVVQLLKWTWEKRLVTWSMMYDLFVSLCRKTNALVERRVVVHIVTCGVFVWSLILCWSCIRDKLEETEFQVVCYVNSRWVGIGVAFILTLNFMFDSISVELIL